MVEVDHPSIALPLLGAAASSRGELELAKVSVHALVPPVVLRAAGTRAHQADAEGDQPSRQVCQATPRTRADERRPIIALHRKRKAVLPEEALEDAPDVHRPSVLTTRATARTFRLQASRTVSGSHLSPLRARHQPLKSIVQRSLGASTSTRGRPSTDQMRTADAAAGHCRGG